MLRNFRGAYSVRHTVHAVALLANYLDGIPSVPCHETIWFFDRQAGIDEPRWWNSQWSDDVDGHPGLRLFWPGLDGPDPAMRDFLRFTRELITLRWRFPALRAEGYAPIHVHDQNRVLAFQRWVAGQGGDVVIVLSLADETKCGYEIGFPSSGPWREVFNSDVYEHWVNPNVHGNGGGVD